MLGADVNAKTRDRGTALHFAVMRVRRDSPLSKLGIVRMLLRHGAEIDALDIHGQTPLMHAIIGTCPALVRLLLARGADPNKAFGRGALIWSIIAGNRDQIAWDMLMAGAKVNEPDCDGETPLYCAAYGDLKFAKALLARRADPNAADKKGMTPLMCATYSAANADSIKMLIDAGADVTAKDNEGRTALMYAQEHAWDGYREHALDLLKEAGAIA